MVEKKSARLTGIIIAAGFAISALSMTYLISSSKLKLAHIKTSGEATLTAPEGKTFKLIPEECTFQFSRGVTHATLNSRSSLDLGIEYNVAVDAALTTLTVKPPGDLPAIIFKKSECEKFDDKVNQSNGSGVIDALCAQAGYTFKGLMRFGACKN